MKPIHLGIEALRVLGSLGSENLHRVLDMLFLLCSNRGKVLPRLPGAAFPTRVYLATANDSSKIS